MSTSSGFLLVARKQLVATPCRGIVGGAGARGALLRHSLEEWKACEAEEEIYRSCYRIHLYHTINCMFYRNLLLYMILIMHIMHIIRCISPYMDLIYDVKSCFFFTNDTLCYALPVEMMKMHLRCT